MLSKLDDTMRRQLLDSMEERSLASGEALFLPDDEAHGVFFVKSGRLGVQGETGFEDKLQMVALLEDGAPVGEKALAGIDRHGLRVIAVEDTQLYYLSGAAFADIEDKNPGLAITLLQELLAVTSLRLEACSRRLARVL